MAEDLYSQVLGVPAEGARPPHHYDLLGIPLFEPDLTKVQAAAEAQNARIQAWIDSNPEAAGALQALAEEVERARLTLMSPEIREPYDQTLGAAAGAPAAAEAPDPAAAPMTAPVHQMQKNTCPECGAGLPPGAVLCTNCGLDLRTGRSVAGSTPSPPAATPPEPAAEDAAEDTGGRRKLVGGGVLVLIVLLVFGGIHWWRSQTADYRLQGKAVKRKGWEEALQQSEFWKCYFAYRAKAADPDRPFVAFTLSEKLVQDGLYEYTEYTLQALDPDSGVARATEVQNVKPTAIARGMGKMWSALAAALIREEARQSPTLVSQVAAGLESSPPAFLLDYLTLIGEIGPAAADAATALEARLAADMSRGVRQAAVQSLIQVLADSPERLAPILGRAVQDRDEEVREHAFTALAGMQGVAVETLAELLGNGDAANQLRAADILRQFGPVNAPSVPALVKLLGSPDEKVRRSAILALGATTIRNETVLKELKAIALNDSEPKGIQMAAKQAYTALDLPGSRWQMTATTKMDWETPGFGVKRPTRKVPGEGTVQYQLAFASAGKLTWRPENGQAQDDGSWGFNGEALWLDFGEKRFEAPIDAYRKLTGLGPQVGAGMGTLRTTWYATRR